MADVVLYDRLVGPAVFDYLRPGARRIDVGKTGGGRSASQARINALMVHHARAGRRVVRLKGGDPFVFGRGGEELEYLRRNGIAAEVVPGITAATGCAAATGIPLTHRDHASAVTFVTGHDRDDADGGPDWATLARVRHTLVVYMGLGASESIAERLIGGGMDAGTPIAVVENGTRPEQRLVTGCLGDLATLVAERRVTGPALTIIGAAAALADADTLIDLAAAAA
jgi:uroporphyrin-III C-methyltransferase/precorrin-2 dehydrogenase/sirohydrochlorin ferrochelatase